MGNFILLCWWSTGWIWIEQANVHSSISDEPFSLRDEFGRHGPRKDPFDCWTRDFWRPVQCHQARRQRYNYNFFPLLKSNQKVGPTTQWRTQVRFFYHLCTSEILTSPNGTGLFLQHFEKLAVWKAQLRHRSVLTTPHLWAKEKIAIVTHRFATISEKRSASIGTWMSNKFLMFILKCAMLPLIQILFLCSPQHSVRILLWPDLMSF